LLNWASSLVSSRVTAHRVPSRRELLLALHFSHGPREFSNQETKLKLNPAFCLTKKRDPLKKKKQRRKEKPAEEKKAESKAHCTEI